MANQNYEVDNDNLWERWSQQQRLRVTAALDLYIYYLVKNFKQRDLFDISVPTDEGEIVKTLLRSVRTPDDPSSSPSEEKDPPDAEQSGTITASQK